MTRRGTTDRRRFLRTLLGPLVLAGLLGLLTGASCSHPLPPAPPGGQLRYLALGDSFTIGTGATPEQSFPARLSDKLRRAGWQVTLRNLGVNGYTTQHLIDAELPAVKAFHPDLLTLAVGANDIVQGRGPDSYRAQVRLILSRLLQDGVPARRILVIPQPDWSLHPAAQLFDDPARLAPRIEGFNDILQKETQAAGARYIDLFPLMRRQGRQGQVAADGLHPSAPAYAEWADRIAETAAAVVLR